MNNFTNKSPKVLVIGDLILDHYLWGSSDRISPEAPVQIVNIEKETKVLGGAGNVVNNLQALGAKVDILSILGNDENSATIRGLIKKIKVEDKFIFLEKDRLSSKKTRIISAQQQVVRFDHESKEDINQKSQKKLLDTFNKIANQFEIILLSDYGKGILTDNLTKSLISIANSNKIKVLVDPKGSNFQKYKGSFLLTPNLKEASEACQIAIKNNQTLMEAIKKIKIECQLQISLITLSDQGVAIYDDKFRKHPTIAKEVFDVTGAGDTVLAALGFSLGIGMAIDESVKFANLAAAVVVGKIGSSTSSLDEIIEYESSINKSASDKHIKTLDEIIKLVLTFKNKSKKIVFTNGCFDLIHTGHIKYLEKAKTFGDILIVGLNSDKSVKSIKGNERPIVNQKDRAYTIAALEVVDYVVIFDEDTPIKLIKSIKPNVLVKGGDYQGKDVVGQDIAEELRIVKTIKGKSSSLLIEQIKNFNN